MKEHPIIFSAEMVCAILEGRKTQTRRVFKNAPDGLQAGRYPAWPEHEGLPPSPYGYPGDRLWVRETFTWTKAPDDFLLTARGLTSTWRPNVDWETWSNFIERYRNRWCPAIFMPRWASRLTLEITGVRIERVQDINEEDAKAEGIRSFTDNLGSRHSNPTMIYSAFPDRDGGFLKARDAFEALWNSINAKRGYGWDTNPCVRVYEFTVNQ